VFNNEIIHYGCVFFIKKFLVLKQKFLVCHYKLDFLWEKQWQNYRMENSELKIFFKDSESGNKPIHLWPVDLGKACQGYSMGKEQSLQQIVLEQLDIHMQKDDVRPLLHIM